MASPTPVRIFDMLNAYQRSAVLKGAIELDLFTAVRSEDGDLDKIAHRVGASRRGIRILCDYLVSLELLEKREERYVLALDSAAFLDRQAPTYLGAAVGFLHDEVLKESFSDVAATVKHGGTLLPRKGSVAPDHPMWGQFARCMGPCMRPAATAVAGLARSLGTTPRTVLDVAASHGEFGFAFLREFPDAMLTALDWPGVLKVTEEHATTYRFGERFAQIAGNAFTATLPAGRFDVILVPNFLHHFDEADCGAVLKRLRAALAPNGRIYIVEFVPNDDRVTPPGSAMFAMTMLCSTPAGDVYTVADFNRIGKASGFESIIAHDLAPGMQRVIELR